MLDVSPIVWRDCEQAFLDQSIVDAKMLVFVDQSAYRRHCSTRIDRARDEPGGTIAMLLFQQPTWLPSQR